MQQFRHSASVCHATAALLSVHSSRGKCTWRLGTASPPACLALTWCIFLLAANRVRYTSAGVIGVYDDMMHLAAADFLVGTFSSQVSRVAYEIKQITGPEIDASFAYHSVGELKQAALGLGLH